MVTVDAAHVEDITQALVVHTEDFFMVLQAQFAGLGLEQRGHVLVGELVEGLLKHGAEVDHRVNVFALAGVLDDRGIDVGLQPVGQLVDRRPGTRAVCLARKRIDAPARVGLCNMTELHLLDVRQAHHRG